MIWKYAKEVLERWSLTAISQRLDKRRLQLEIDTHRLFLLLEFNKRATDGAEESGSNQRLAEEMASSAEKLSHEEMKSRVEDRLSFQVASIAKTLNAALIENGDPAEAASAMQQWTEEGDRPPSPSRVERRNRGLASAVGGAAGTSPSGRNGNPSSKITGARKANNARLGMDRVAELFQERMGFSLDLRPSGQSRGESGTGLWLRGRAQLGSVVALYPGLVYSPLTYRKIPGYPRVDVDNDYLISRFDGCVLDAKPWGRGGSEPLHAGSTPSDPRSLAQNSSSFRARTWQQQVETRHPLALAHFANHPSKPSEPNTMVAAFDFSSQPGNRAYVPNLEVVWEAEEPRVLSPSGRVPGLALVAIRPLEDEELLLNYRLSTHVSRPGWYQAVDEEEERRRWA